MTQRSRITLAVTATAATALVLAACGSSGTKATSGASTSGMGSMSMSGSASAGSTTGSHNQADVTFATDMIPHHAQAVQMADMALKAATNSQVKTLAATIKKAQDPEITEMTGWLTSWKKPVPPTMGGMSMGHGTGMMTDADMTRLGKATGATFDRLWVTMMITHHHGAVSMARTELTSGQYTSATTLARSIVTSQSAQITQLQTLLTQLPKA
jgi:uncharacterized protein (DUF305 family)